MHNAEQMYAEASHQLDKVIEYAASVMPQVYANAGGNADISVVYDWWKAYIQLAEEQGQNVANLIGAQSNGAHDTHVCRCHHKTHARRGGHGDQYRTGATGKGDR
jgi:hypothetical protein